MMQKKHLFILLVLFLGLKTNAQIAFEETLIDDDDNLSIGYTIGMSRVDIDGDGDIDIVAVVETPNRLVWYENVDGLGNFHNAPVVISNSTDSITTIDIDGDGDIDILSEFYWYENTDGLGSFGTAQIIDENPENPGSINAQLPFDIDGDGDIDIISKVTGKIILYEYLSEQGMYSIPQDLVIDAGLEFVSFVKFRDIDNDGDIDILGRKFSDSQNKLVWYENFDGQGLFLPIQDITDFLNNIQFFDFEDLDGDGDKDVFLVEKQQDGMKNVHWYKNTDGQGNFGAQLTVVDNLDNLAVNVYAVDIDNDLDLDLLIKEGNELSWFENTDGGGTFVFNQVIVSITNNYILDDNDSDGDIDILYTVDGIGFWIENANGQGMFNPAEMRNKNIIGARGGLDLDGDGLKDAAGASQAFTFWARGLLDEFENGRRMISHFPDDEHVLHSEDIDGDGDEDIVVGGDLLLSWHENLDGLGTYGRARMILERNQETDWVLAADANNDGFTDVITYATYDDRVFWHKNLDGNGNFSELYLIDWNIPGAKMDFADINGDLFKDLIIVKSNGYIFRRSLADEDDLYFYGSNEVIATHTYGSPSKVRILDVDNDGDNDILVAFKDNNVIVWYENTDGQANFSDEQIIADNIEFSSLQAIDYDLDGDSDLLVSLNTLEEIVLYENTNGQFNLPQTLITNTVYTDDISAADIDLDGDIDIISGSDELEKLVLYENSGGLNNFLGPQLITSSNYAEDIELVDVDADGTLDIITALNGDYLAYYKTSGNTINRIDGEVSLDAEGDGCSTDDISLDNFMIVTDNGTETIAKSTEDGFFYFLVEEGVYNTSIASELPSYFVSNPITHNNSFVGVGNAFTADFCIEPIGIANDANVSVYPLFEARPGFITTYQLVYRNMGITELNGQVSFEFDDSKLQFTNASEVISSQTANSLSFDYSGLSPFEIRTIDLNFIILPPPFVEIDDILLSTVSISSSTGDETPDDNIFNLQETVIGSFDPNDIAVLEGESITYDARSKYLHYIIRFQNTGTASAINVNVENMLDPKLDWSTFQLESLSHYGRVEIVNGNEAKFIFNDIFLPDSTNDEPNSHGYIAYKIKPKSNVEIGDVFSGTADIFFDFNPPITTNTVNTEIVEPLSIDEFNTHSIQLFPNPTKSKLEITSNQIIDKLTVIDINGRVLNETKVSSLEYRLDVSSLTKGVYFLEIQFGASKTTKKFIKN